MNYSSIVTYIWLKEALLALFNTWASDNDLFAMIASGNVAYELCRPVSIYSMWFSRTTGARIAEAIMRCIPVLLCAFLMPEAYRMTLPVNGVAFWLFLLTLFLALGITVTFCMLVYMQNVPFRIYSGDLADGEIYQCILKQVFWLVTLMCMGIAIWKQAELSMPLSVRKV